MAQPLRALDTAPADETNDNTPRTTDIVVAVNADPGLVLLDRQRFDQFYEAIKEETDKLVPDTTSEKGRAAIKAMAFKVTKTKTAIDAAGKLLKEEAQATVNKVDAARREIKGRLEDLAVEVRKPLTAWEAAEETRLATVKEAMDRLQHDGIVSADETVADVESRLGYLRALTFDADVFQDWAPLAATARGNAIQSLETALTRLQREAADRAELDRLRAEAAERAERERAEAEAKAAAEAAERHRAEAEARAAAEAAAAEDRIAAAAKAAEDAARQAAEAKANEDRVAAERVHAEALAAEKRRADEAEAARAAETARIAKEAAAREAEARSVAAEAARVQAAAEARAADVAHRGKIMGAAKSAIMALGIGEAAAKSVVLAIAAGDVPAVSIRF
jgi:DNA repair exonuclease SbcCD ATPase subunit